MKKLTALITLLFVVLVAFAKVTLPFTVPEPTWQKLAAPSLRSSATIPYYKTASTTAAKLYVKNAGYAVMWECNEMEGIVMFYIGKKTGNFIVFKYQASYYEVVNNTNVSFKSTDFFDFNINQFKESDFAKILQVAEQLDSASVIFYDGETSRVLYDILKLTK